MPNYNLLNLAIAILAVYRISRLVVAEDGPFGLIVRTRQQLEQRFKPGHWLYEGIICPLCVSFWLSLPAALWLFSGDTVGVIVTWFGIAGAVTLIYRKGE